MGNISHKIKQFWDNVITTIKLTCSFYKGRISLSVNALTFNFP